MSNKILKNTIYSGFFGLISASIAYAQPPKDQGERAKSSVEELFKQMDANKDNKLSKEEIKGPLKDDFAKVDTDKDGFLTLEELKKAPKPER